MTIEELLKKLGYEAEDRATGFSGVLTEIVFGVSGNIYGLITPPIDESGNRIAPVWIELYMIKFKNYQAMERSDFNTGDGDKVYFPALANLDRNIKKDTISEAIEQAGGLM